MLDIKRPKNYHGKTIICGDSTVGKTAISQLLCSDGLQFPKSYLMTTAVELAVKTVVIPNTEDTVEMLLYDTPGKDIFKDFVQMHLQNVCMVAFVYDITNRDSYESLPSWEKKVESQNPNFIGVIIANKSDLNDRSEVSAEEGELMSHKLNMPIFHCSAKDNDNIETPFLHLAKLFYENESKKSYQV
ncbi:intraflagellar transport protein 27 homolog isoform X2 [Hydra vulgaris]|uniref:Intraflagellar transport protein 27 homolog isoform X2 n=1 Tax=Hydra vulgaris TaxID=6087 RepID=A0ABM4CCH1_HYDVU